MIKFHPDYPDYKFEWHPKEDGEGLIIAWDLQSYTAGCKWAFEEGLSLVPDDNNTVKIGAQMQVRVVDKVVALEFTKASDKVKMERDFEEKDEDAQEKEKEISSEETDTVEATEQFKEEGEVDFAELLLMENTKPNRTYIDNMAKEFGIEIDRRKFKTVRVIVEEFKRLYKEL